MATPFEMFQAANQAANQAAQDYANKMGNIELLKQQAAKEDLAVRQEQYRQAEDMRRWELNRASQEEQNRFNKAFTLAQAKQNTKQQAFQNKMNLDKFNVDKERLDLEGNLSKSRLGLESMRLNADLERLAEDKRLGKLSSAGGANVSSVNLLSQAKILSDQYETRVVPAQKGLKDDTPLLSATQRRISELEDKLARKNFVGIEDQVSVQRDLDTANRDLSKIMSRIKSYNDEINSYELERNKTTTGLYTQLQTLEEAEKQGIPVDPKHKQAIVDFLGDKFYTTGPYKFTSTNSKTENPKVDTLKPTRSSVESIEKSINSGQDLRTNVSDERYNYNPSRYGTDLPTTSAFTSPVQPVQPSLVDQAFAPVTDLGMGVPRNVPVSNNPWLLNQAFGVPTDLPILPVNNPTGYNNPFIVNQAFQ